jgi:hypothetical protein
MNWPLSPPPTVTTVNLTEPVFFGMPDIEAVQGAEVDDVLQVPEPLAPLLHCHVTAAPLLVVTITLAVQVDPLLVLELLSVTVGPDVEPLGVALASFETFDSFPVVSTAVTT